MNSELVVLCSTAASISFLHTLTGPDHYLPFIAFAKTNNWSKNKTFWVTLVCGLAHVLSSIILGFVGLTAGIALFKLEKLESIRGDIAAWFLLIFGFVYFVWSVFNIVRKKPHMHLHKHANGTIHQHKHVHQEEHMHLHKNTRNKSIIWSLFIIFIFGPCEPLIPLIMFPAAKGNIMWVVLVASIFGIVTIGLMLSVVMASISGLSIFKSKSIAKYSHVIAGFILFSCGGTIFLGL